MAKMRIHLSGEENLARPEIVLGDKSDIMMSFYMIRPKKNGKPDKRFRLLYALRKRQQKEKEGSS